MSIAGYLNMSAAVTTYERGSKRIVSAAGNRNMSAAGTLSISAAVIAYERGSKRVASAAGSPP